MDLWTPEEYEIDRTAFYGGNAGRKLGIIAEGSRWMVKFPRRGRDSEGRCRHAPSCMTGPLGEFVGSAVYASLGIPVHEVRLGFLEGRLVAFCRDFNRDGSFVEYAKIKNAFPGLGDLECSGTSGRGEYLSDALAVLAGARPFAEMSEALGRFWDMFVVDAFIGNGARDNCSWGIMARAAGFELAPVFGNGSSFSGKRNPSVAAGMLGNGQALREDAIGDVVSFFLDSTGERIHPFRFIADTDDEGCLGAVERFRERIDMDSIASVIESVPEEAHGVEIMPRAVKDRCLAEMEIRLSEDFGSVSVSTR